MLRSILSVIVGYVVIGFTVMLCTFVVGVIYPEFLEAETSGVTSPTPAVVLLLILGLPCGVLGGATCALIAGRARLRHAVILAGIAFVLGLAMAIFARQPSQPVWYVYALPISAALSIILGGWLVERFKR